MLPLSRPSFWALKYFTGHSNILRNCKADEFAKVGALHPEASSIELRMPSASFKLVIARKFFRDANLFWVNKKSCSTAGLT